MQEFGRRIGSDTTIDPVMPFTVAHPDEPEIVTISEIQSVYALYHAVFMGDMSDMTLAEVQQDVLPAIFAEIEGVCQFARPQ